MSTTTDVYGGPPQGPRRGAPDSSGDAPLAPPEPQASHALRNALRADLGPIRPVSFGSLIRVEFRKMFNTAAARWYSIAIGLILALIIVAMFFSGGGAHGFALYFNVNVQTLGYLLPILGILAVTSEWSQRTAMTTFSLEPRRGRVVAAKTVVTLALSAVIFGVAIGLGALGNLASIVLRDAPSDWTMSGTFLGSVAIWLALTVLMGLGFALLIQNTPGAIVAFLLLPIASVMIFEIVTGLHDIRDWVDISFAFAPMLEGDGLAGLTGEDWAKVGTASAIWVGLPLLLGTWRTLRREVK